MIAITGDMSDIWQAEGKILKDEFDKVRKGHSDSAARGAGNEEILVEFLRRNSPLKVVTNSTVIDSMKRSSGEQDLIVCNEYQPFVSKTRAATVIAEGVGVVIQVKAKLDKAEIGHCVSNAESVKRLSRNKDLEGLRSKCSAVAIDNVVKKCPYIVVAYNAVRQETAIQHVRDKFSGVAVEYRPDAFIALAGEDDSQGDYAILKQGLVFNVASELPIADGDYVAVRGSGVALVSLIHLIYGLQRQVDHKHHPLLKYFDSFQTSVTRV